MMFFRIPAGVGRHTIANRLVTPVNSNIGMVSEQRPRDIFVLSFTINFGFRHIFFFNIILILVLCIIGAILFGDSIKGFGEVGTKLNHACAGEHAESVLLCRIKVLVIMSGKDTT